MVEKWWRKRRVVKEGLSDDKVFSNESAVK